MGLGVCIAAVNYVLNLRETNRNRRITTTTTLVQSMLTLETLHIEGDFYTMTWRDWDDFRSKYDSSVNIDNFTYRMKLWGIYEVIGTLYRSELLDMKSLFSRARDPKCTSCGVCVDRCHFGAREIKNGKLEYNKDLCFGCGLCVNTCPTSAISLIPLA